MDDLEKVRSKKWHTVRNKKRRNLLLNRGEDIRWSVELGCWIWRYKKKVLKG